jgi:hypothetical protein
MEQLDQNSDGYVDFNEFESWWLGRQQGEELEQELTDLFAQVDTDFSGTVDWAEFLQMIGQNLERENTRETAIHIHSGTTQAQQDKKKRGRVVHPKQRPVRDAFRMVREALESVKADVRASQPDAKL